MILIHNHFTELKSCKAVSPSACLDFYTRLGPCNFLINIFFLNIKKKTNNEVVMFLAKRV